MWNKKDKDVKTGASGNSLDIVNTSTSSDMVDIVGVNNSVDEILSGKYKGFTFEEYDEAYLKARKENNSKECNRILGLMIEMVLKVKVMCLLGIDHLPIEDVRVLYRYYEEVEQMVWDGRYVIKGYVATVTTEKEYEIILPNGEPYKTKEYDTKKIF